MAAFFHTQLPKVHTQDHAGLCGLDDRFEQLSSENCRTWGFLTYLVIQQDVSGQSSMPKGVLGQWRKCVKE